MDLVPINVWDSKNHERNYLNYCIQLEETQ